MRRGNSAGGRRRRVTAVSLWFVVPALVIYGLVVIYPSISGAVYAFTDWRGGSSASFVGLRNFRELLSDPKTAGALRNTMLLTVVGTVVQTVLGLLLALALNSAIKSRNLLRTLFFAPALLPPVVIAVLWQYLYTPGGVIDRVLDTFGLGALSQNWLGNSSVALWSVLAVIVWQNVGLTMVIYLAGLQGIPDELYEAASIDGAGTMASFWNVTRPMLAPATTIAVALIMISNLKLFDQVFVMTGGGPGYATETLSLVMYKEAFVLGHYGYGAAVALVLTMLVAALVFVQVTITRRFEVEQ
ncbi:sugar ABC transporter permease [Phytoactinopolyspora alkaliphila]|uniref:Sugar ABC transporter permease n=1 Tax=Phytoactinopolyspora alkaliphila TaxID=1783498 RepID=A0A6N9YKD2_9ACTN|nr:sugar ABC transporter permease [Phytoactinopolyspora alkaliphila]